MAQDLSVCLRFCDAGPQVSFEKHGRLAFLRKLILEYNYYKNRKRIFMIFFYFFLDKNSFCL